MPRPKKWIKTFFDHGIEHTRLSSWKYFPDYINQHMLNFPGYIYRGQRSEHWKMESTLDRLIRKIPVKQREKIKDFILANFLYAIRGRRGDNPCKLTDNEMWSLGQHHGLSTPMLDFTLSPYVAAFFALAEGRDVVDGDATVWAVHDYSITEKSKEITKDLVGIDNSAPALIKRIEPLIDENARLVNQSGCFLYLPEKTDLEEWVKTHFNSDVNGEVLIKLTIPAKDREFALTSLNRMNINYLSLFPDLYGASMHCNLSAEVQQYG